MTGCMEELGDMDIDIFKDNVSWNPLPYVKKSKRLLILRILYLLKSGKTESHHFKSVES